MLSDKCELIDDSLQHDTNKIQQPLQFVDLLLRIREIVSMVAIKTGVFTSNHMSAAGFQYTGDGDTARCNDCGLEVSNWTLDMNPFTIHSKQKPDCPFIRSTISSSLSNIPSSSSSSTTAIRNTSISNEQENPSKRQKIETINSESSSNTLFETDLLQQVTKTYLFSLATSYHSFKCTND